MFTNKMFERKSFLVKTKVSLKKYTSFAVGGEADYLIIIKNKKELIQAINEIKKNNLSFFILGKGSNVLFSDKDFKKIILKIEIDNISIEKSDVIKAESGTSLSKLVSFCLNHELSGLEWAFGIPGTIGGAIKGNSGAFGKSMKDSVVNVEVYDIKKEEFKIINNKDCQFKYRESLFKQKPNYIITGTELKFKKRKKALIEKEMKLYLGKRKKKQPCGFSAGSVFKNYEIKNKKEKEFILKRYPEMKKIITNNTFPVSYLIEQCGLKGKKIGDALISEVHANFIINLGQAKSSDIKKLINVVKKEVKKKFKISIEEEIIVV